jgi:hypothetical protein
VQAGVVAVSVLARAPTWWRAVGGVAAPVGGVAAPGLARPLAVPRLRPSRLPRSPCPRRTFHSGGVAQACPSIGGARRACVLELGSARLLALLACALRFPACPGQKEIPRSCVRRDDRARPAPVDSNLERDAEVPTRTTRASSPAATSPCLREVVA